MQQPQAVSYAQLAPPLGGLGGLDLYASPDLASELLDALYALRGYGAEAFGAGPGGAAHSVTACMGPCVAGVDQLPIGTAQGLPQPNFASAGALDTGSLAFFPQTPGAPVMPPGLGVTGVLPGAAGGTAADLVALKEALNNCSPTPSVGSVAGGGIGPSTNPLYKTELCRSWEETGTCRYGLKCQFAHGREELRPVLRHPKYKTEICRSFANTGTCPYGTRCRFIHQTTNVSPIKTSGHSGVVAVDSPQVAGPSGAVPGSAPAAALYSWDTHMRFGLAPKGALSAPATPTAPYSPLPDGVRRSGSELGLAGGGGAGGAAVAGGAASAVAGRRLPIFANLANE